MDAIQPTGVKADRTQRKVIISWSNGATCELPFAGLRAICPCVECRGGHSNMGQPPDLTTLHSAQDETLSLEQIAAVGSYALQILWSDGHSTGIYSWDYLRQACEL